MTSRKADIVILGDGQLACSIAVCLSRAGHSVTIKAENCEKALNTIKKYWADPSESYGNWQEKKIPIVVKDLSLENEFGIGIIITSEKLKPKKASLRALEKFISADSVIAVNTETIPLSILQQDSNNPGRIVGVNWVEPAHTTYFLELISNKITKKSKVQELFDLAKSSWAKDPYIIFGERGIRAKLISVLAREAFYLVENGYASVEDIDRACRNDAGYYLPFAGNFRYMDLMGTYAYGLVMKDLNRELSKEMQLPDFFKKIIENDGLGMQNLNGFYEYSQDEVKEWHELFNEFSYQIRDLIKKYPFNYDKI